MFSEGHVLYQLKVIMPCGRKYVLIQLKKMCTKMEERDIFTFLCSFFVNFVNTEYKISSFDLLFMQSKKKKITFQGLDLPRKTFLQDTLVS